MKTLLLVLVLLASCSGEGFLEDADGGADGGGSDSDSDVDSDVDGDTDTDTDTDWDCEEDGCGAIPLDVCDSFGNLIEYDSSYTCVNNECVWPFDIIGCDLGCTDAPDGEDDYCTEPDTEDCNADACMLICTENGYDVGVCIDGECECY